MRRAARFALLLALAGAGAPSCDGADPRPDIVLVVWDTCRRDRLSLYGHDRPTTPWLEGFARDAVRYDRCYTPAPFTAPAHASLFSGLAPHRHGLAVGRGDRVHAGVPLLAETLKAAGYETACFTSNAYISDLTGLNRGFDLLVPVWKEQKGEAHGGHVLEAVEAWLARRRPDPAKDGPFFVFLNFMDPHQPLDPPAAEVAAVRGPEVSPDDLFQASQVDQEAVLRHLLGVRRIEEGALRGLRTRYDASVRFMDRNTGEVLDRLGKAGILRDAFVAIAGDHGENLGEHGLLDHRLSCHDTLLHVPLVVRRPGRYAGGRVVGTTVSLMDLYPSILDAAGVPAPEGNGIDAAALPAEGAGGGRALLAEYVRPLAYLEEARGSFPEGATELFAPFRVTITAVRDPADRPGARKYTRWTGLDERGAEVLQREALHDYPADPLEERDLLAARDAAARAEADRLAALLPALRAGPAEKPR